MYSRFIYEMYWLQYEVYQWNPMESNTYRIETNTLH